MQTFLPYPSFSRSASVLDNSRLGNQCYRECLTLYNGGWANHPAAKMWEGHKGGLARYALAMALEMMHRCENGTGPWRDEICRKWIDYWSGEMQKHRSTAPSWIGDRLLHASHRSCLLAKDPAHYGKFNWAEAATPPDDKGKWPYHWPISTHK